MKITFLSLVLIVALSTKLALAGPAQEEVVDTSGKKVVAGANYYIVSASPKVGGLSLAMTDKQCPLDVVAVNGYKGLPLVFTPVNLKKGVVRLNTDLNIYFSSQKTTCPQSKVWKVYDDYDLSHIQYFITTGGVIGNPGQETIGNWFKIEKYEDAYKLVYCPSVCGYCSYQCSDIGIFEDQYGKHLALNKDVSDVPYKIQFQQA
ncbi:Proteinase inhibitor I3, Kunitz legume [Sesbania bispinosa]|nr:Proteinase inhibitor I3, Kunitz legume [Sesbania bispinosa]